ncbi:hypothetical protein B5X24_HaOG213492 [Helicoverpa armigera]|uniref:Phorbol-ester/DAG-type domain-containing protein n=1 Tax=Helicoverpa armigera TaxID=29058 RepID=A0A2W1B9F6_HELAM|nr:hypothetical protein B5X24_HaOG213492 [Helicoverpa armigera]
MCGQLRAACRSGAAACCGAPHGSSHATHDTHATLIAALIAAALCLHCSLSAVVSGSVGEYIRGCNIYNIVVMVNTLDITEVEALKVRRRWWQSPKSKHKKKLKPTKPASVAAAVGGSRASFLQRDKLYKQRVKQITKQHPQPFVVRGHHLQLQALTSVAHCHHCDNIIWGLAPQAYVCTDCKLRVHRGCARDVEEGCCLDGEHHNNRISRFIERIHANNTPNNIDSNDKKSRKASGPAHFLNMERSFRKAEDDPPWDQTLTPSVIAID